MRRISAMIQPPRVDDVCEALLALDIADLTVTEAHGFGRQNGHTTLYPDTGRPIDLLPKAKIELMVASERLCEVVASITKAANTGKNGAGKIFVSTILRTINL
ncbi:P-II family nitrogen regulator [Acidithiobacillus sulfuriphilus]|uniref:P-II family nitrogen regulator n=1 Tax=Acidithiobacillus sulfuriphilus TaxID=1867749 RepID=UPI003F5E8E94